MVEQMARVSVDTTQFTLTTVPAKGPRKEFELPQLDNSRPPGYWLPRNVLQQMLYDEVRRPPGPGTEAPIGWIRPRDCWPRDRCCSTRQSNLSRDG